ncbi:GNAT family N-acetyltransferase [Algiphilus sp.]|uniref:GNAT family N-acetyltransferase n=1 Tax=Algiphilus sp. TaxID=1872431 RepID=UPI003B5199A0
MSAEGLCIRAYRATDWDALWPLLQAEFATGESHPQAPDISEAAAHQSWIEAPEATFVAECDGALVGTYLIKPNQPGLGAHVCNCGYIVAQSARHQGVGRALCLHSLETARRRGYRAMQYNLVVATNTSALRLWHSMGFQTVGRLPEAFRHPRHGWVDAFVMTRALNNAGA